MIAGQNIYNMFFHPTASPTAEGGNCAYGPTLHWYCDYVYVLVIRFFYDISK